MTFVTVTNALPNYESLANLSDAEIIASVKSEINAFLDGACWLVERGVFKPCFDDECLRSLADAEDLK
jgi:hypothetical protein